MFHPGEQKAVQNLLDDTGVDLVSEMSVWLHQALQPLRDGWHLSVGEMETQVAASAIGLHPFDFFVYRGGLVRTGWVTKKVIRDQNEMRSLVMQSLREALRIHGIEHDVEDVLMRTLYPAVYGQQELVAA